MYNTDYEPPVQGESDNATKLRHRKMNNAIRRELYRRRKQRNITNDVPTVSYVQLNLLHLFTFLFTL